MRALDNIRGFKTVFLSGRAPRFIVKSATTVPHVVALRGDDVRSLDGCHTEFCESGFLYVDNNVSISSKPAFFDIVLLLMMECRTPSACAKFLQTSILRHHG